MSEAVRGVHVQLTGDSNNYAAAMDRAMNEAVRLKSELTQLKMAERELQKELDAGVQKFGRKSTEAQKLKADLIANANAQKLLGSEINKLNSQIQQQTTHFMKNAQSANTAAGQIKSAFTILKAIAVGYAGRTLFDALIGDNAKFEQYITSFEVMLGSAEKAQKMMDDITKFAAKTPLELPDVTKATQLLLNYGVAQEDVMKRLQQLGDLSMGNAEKLDRVSLAYGQMLAKGKVTGEELRQMTEAGVPLNQALADAIGKSTAELAGMIEKGEIGIPVLNRAIENLTSQGGKFFGMMDKESKTMSGMFSTLKDDVGLFAREVGEESFDYVKNELTDLMATIDEMREDGSLNALAKEMGEDVANAIRFLAEFIKIAYEMKEVIFAAAVAYGTYKITASAATLVITGLTNASNLLGVVIGKNVVLRNLETGATIICTAAQGKQIAATNQAIVAQTGLNAVMAANPIGMVAAAIGLVTGALVAYYSIADQATNKTNELNNRLKEINSTYESAIKATNAKKTATEGEINVTESLVNRLYELAGAENKTTAQKKEMKTIVEELNRKYPEFQLKINDTTWSLNKEKGAVDALILSYRNLAIAKAYQGYAEAEGKKVADLSEAKKVADQIEANAKTELDKYTPGYFDPYSAFSPPINKDTGLAVSPDTYLSIQDNYEEAKTKREQIDSDLYGANYNLDYYTKEALKLMGENEPPDTKPPPLETGSSKSKSDKAEQERKKKVDAYKDYINEMVRADERWNDHQVRLGKQTEEQDIWALGNRANTYRLYAADVTKQAYMTKDEKVALIKEFTEKADDLELQYYERMKAMREDAFEDSLQNSKEYIDTRNFYNDWGADNEVAAWERVIAAVEEAKNEGVISFAQYVEEVDEINKKMYTAVQAEIKKQEESLKKQYTDELKAAEDLYNEQLELKKKALDRERELVQKRTDAELEAIDRLIQKRKQEREDTDDSLSLERLQNSLAYEMDEDNRRTLSKQITQKQQEIDDKKFEREMQAKRDQIKNAEQLELERIKRTEEYEIESTKYKIDVQTAYYKAQISDINIAKEIAKSTNIQDFVSIGEQMGEGLAEGINKAVSSLLSKFSISVTGTGQGATYNNQKSVVYSPSYSVTGSSAITPAQLAAQSARMFKQLTLQGDL